MPRLRSAEHALRLFADISRQPYICRSCRSQAIRQFHSFPPVFAKDVPFFKRIRESLFGSEASREQKRKQEEKEQKAIEEEAERAKPRTVYIKGRKYNVAPVVDPNVNKEYVPATTWDGLERMGSAKFVKEKADRGEKYVG